jgi:hypothetical protein
MKIKVIAITFIDEKILLYLSGNTVLAGGHVNILHILIL